MVSDIVLHDRPDLKSNSKPWNIESCFDELNFFSRYFGQVFADLKRIPGKKNLRILFDNYENLYCG